MSKEKVKIVAKSGGGMWFGGFIGALIYYWSSIESFASFWVALFKAVFWPIYVVYELHKLLGL